MLTLPNMLTLSRIFAIPLLALFLWWPGWETGFLLAFGLYCLMGITDYFDGYLARTSFAEARRMCQSSFSISPMGGAGGTWRLTK